MIKMEEYPDLSFLGYQIDGELGRNREGGRITWRGIDLNSQQIVTIKQFCFAVANSSWSGYKAYTQEIAILQKLNHSGIPQYLNSIETKDGFCLIQTYIDGDNLAETSCLNVPQTKQIALKLLDILIYLQQQNPPVLHRDLKPDNVLLDRDGNVYLIDFGFASLGSLEVSGSSVFKGTPGFIAPEQIIKPIPASDIYALGVTLVCLLSGKDIAEIRSFSTEDNPYQLSIEAILPNLDRQLSKWLIKMTNAKVSQRFNSAIAAKEALLAINNHNLEDNAHLTVTSPSSSDLIPFNSVVVAGMGISLTTAAAIESVNFVQHHLNLTFSNVAIAIVAAIAISVTELGAISLAQVDRQARTPGAILGIVMPTLLVAVSGLIWGIAEAVTIATAIAITEILILSYFWWQLPIWQTQLPLKIAAWSSAIALGVGVAWQLI